MFILYTGYTMSYYFRILMSVMRFLIPCVGAGALFLFTLTAFSASVDTPSKTDTTTSTDDTTSTSSEGTNMDGANTDRAVPGGVRPDPSEGSSEETDDTKEEDTNTPKKGSVARRRRKRECLSGAC